MKTLLPISVLLFLFSIHLSAQIKEHKWVNVPSSKNYNNVTHHTYFSSLHQTDVGYNIALPKGYGHKKNAHKRYAVVYFMHGGNPGNENKIGYANFIKPTDEIEALTPIIYVWNNGGKHKSHYDFPQFNSYAESTFIKELIPHIDNTYRTIKDRKARGIQGYSMGGRAAARYVFKYPEVFSVSVSMAGGHQREKENALKKGNNGEFKPTDNSWELPKIYAKNPNPAIKLYVFSGTEDFNHDSNMEWTKHLRELKIHHSFTTVEGLKHKDIRKMMEQLGPKTIHYIFYQNFKPTIDSYNLKHSH